MPLLACLVFVGCTSLPAQTPPQLQQTPGAFIVVEDSTVKTPLYWVDVPVGWKIVKSSIAADPITLVFAAPDDAMVIRVSETAFPEADEPALINRQAAVEVSDGRMVYLWGEAQAEFEAVFFTAFETVSRSIRPPD